MGWCSASTHRMRPRLTSCCSTTATIGASVFAASPPGPAYGLRVAGPSTVSALDRYGELFNAWQPLGDPYAYRTQNVRYANLFNGTPFVDSGIDLRRRRQEHRP